MVELIIVVLIVLLALYKAVHFLTATTGPSGRFSGTFLLRRLHLTVAEHSYVDVGIKVMSLPYTILEPAQQGDTQRSIAFAGEVGMCFAGSAVNSLTLKESVVEIFKTLQYPPGFTNTSMVGIKNFLFTAYKMVSKEICSALGANGRAKLVFS